MRYRRAMMLMASDGGNRVPVIAQLVAADEDVDPQVRRLPDMVRTRALHCHLRWRNANACCPIDEPFLGGQSYGQVVTATRAFLHGLATGWDGSRILVTAHSANRWALEHLLTGTPLEELLQAPSTWRPGRHYTLSADWPASVR